MLRDTGTSENNKAVSEGNILPDMLNKSEETFQIKCQYKMRNTCREINLLPHFDKNNRLLYQFRK